MMPPDIAAKFKVLCRQADSIDAVTLDICDLEPVFVALLNLVQSHPEQKPLFIELFLAVADGVIETPPELLPFCMRTLRYPEIKAHLLAECASDQNTARFRRRMNFISHVMHAFDDPIWEGAPFWPYYAHEQHKRIAERS